VANGADPLTVVVPSFSLKSIRQSTPGSGATNTLTVSLTADFDLAAGSMVTITGLTGSQTANSASFTVSSTSGLLGTSGSWTQASGQLMLTAAGPGTVSGTACEVTFQLTNAATSQASPAVSVSAEILGGSGISVGSIASMAMTKPGTDLYGVANGADPLRVEVPSPRFASPRLSLSLSSPPSPPCCGDECQICTIAEIRAHLINLLLHVQSSASYHHCYTLTARRTHALTDSTHAHTRDHLCTDPRMCRAERAHTHLQAHGRDACSFVRRTPALTPTRANTHIPDRSSEISVQPPLHTLSHLPFSLSLSLTARAHGPRCGLTQRHDTPPGAGV
jgi:hypothetical protein